MNQIASSRRLYSLDALRGFDMLMIIGADKIFKELAKASGAPFWDAIGNQFKHATWDGFNFYDLIFPLFIFLAGVATPYSIGQQMEAGVPRKTLLFKVIKRGLILVILGIITNNGLEFQPISQMRFESVLGRIGLAYMISSIIYIYTKQRGLVISFCLVLVGYWLLMRFNSAPGFPPGTLTVEGNFASYIDRSILPGKFWKSTIHDPEGLLSTIPAIASGIMGIFAGNLLKNGLALPRSKALMLVIAGLVSIAIAQLWNLIFPINKNLWTSSFVLNAGGISLILLASFYFVIDVLGYKKWAFFFRVIGMNSILIYISGHFIKWDYSANAFFHWLGQLAGNPYNAVVMAVCLVAVKWLFLYFCYEKKVFLRV